jgi:hypothetical protein
MKNVRWLLRRAAWILVLLLLLGVVAWTVGNVVATSRFEGALRGLQEAGYPTSLIGMAPASPPPGEDAAPYYTAALALHVKPPEDSDVEWDPEPLGKIVDMTPEQRTKLKTWVAANQESFDMLARARGRSRCRYEHDFAQGYSMLLPEVQHLLALSRTLRVRAVLQSLDGDVAGAQDSVRSILALGESLREEPVLIEQLVRIVALRLAMGAVDACVSATTSEADLKAWVELLPPNGFLDEALSRAARGEIGMLADTVAGGPRIDFDQMMLGLPMCGPLLRPMVRSDAARFLEIMRQASEAYAKPYPAARIELDQIEAGFREKHWSRPVCNSLLPSFRKSLETMTAAKANVAVVRAGLLAELARAKSGKAPERLETADPFTGKPLTIDAAGKIASAGPEKTLLPNNDPIEWVLRGQK